MKVIIVDDRLENIRVLELMLKNVAKEIATARNGEEALRKVRAEKFDLMLTDVMMPRMDGFQLCHEVRADRSLDSMAVVFVTATYTDAKDESFARSIGVDGFFVKPLDPETFPKQITALMAKRAGGEMVQRRESIENDAVYWREYAARVVRKLEDKLNELEIAHTRQRMLSQTLELRVQERTASLEAKTKELEARTHELEATNRELEAFAYSISHDLRAPLRSIEGFTIALDEEFGANLDEDAKKYLNVIRRSTRQMESLLHDLLAYSRVTTATLTPEVVDTGSVARTAIEWLAGEISAKNARVDVPPDLPKVLGHRATLQQVFFNLISNGIKFVAAGVRPIVEIGTGASTIPDEAGRFVHLWVEDNGIGIAPENQSRIFNLFQRLHSRDAYPGTGLGLAIVRRGIERMGGRFGVHSTVGSGSCFWLELPRADAVPARSEPLSFATQAK